MPRKGHFFETPHQRDEVIRKLPYVSGAMLRDPGSTFFGIQERGPAWNTDPSQSKNEPGKPTDSTDKTK